ncbi:MAG: thiamine pyrophosphate-dependent enzyme [Candidatus Korarchaeota archaeon]|nr:thiamine pyrophosphate-dependent enzyme [Thermoproteota archaeon]
MSLKEIISKPDLLLRGHSACPGCPSTIALRMALKALGEKTILVIPASCSSVYQGVYPGVSFNVITYNVAFASAAAVASGIKRALTKKGYTDVNVVAWGGDGGLVDIGLATVSGAAERGEDIIVICYDNEAYMNTGIQRSGATPPGAWTTTTWAGKTEIKKPMPFILLDHGVRYVATTSVGYPIDIYNKVKKAASFRGEGLRYIHILAPDPPGWRFDSSLTIELGRLAVETGFWPLWEAEVIGGKIKFRLTPPSTTLIDPSKRVPLERFIEKQGRFRAMKEWHVEKLRQQMELYWELVRAFLSLSSGE